MPMIDPATLIAFAMASFAVTASPGPDTLLILHRSVAGGQRVGLATVAGVQVGLLGHTLLAVFGLSVVIVSSPVLFRGIAVAGAVYLGWLAFKILRSGVLDDAEDPRGGRRAACLPAFRDAVLCNALNPKVILMFLALMPNFVDIERGSVPLQLAVLGAVMIAINTVWQIPLSLAAEAAGAWLRRPLVKRAIDWGSGGVLAAFAILLVTEHVL